MHLSEKTCLPCRGGVPPLTEQEYKPLIAELTNWQVEGGKKLSKSVKLKDFQESLSLANAIGRLAEEQGHHPDLTVRWGELGIEVWTHAIDGLTESDFILAAKIDRLIAKQKR